MRDLNVCEFSRSKSRCDTPNIFATRKPTTGRSRTSVCVPSSDGPLVKITAPASRQTVIYKPGREVIRITNDSARPAKKAYCECCKIPLSIVREQKNVDKPPRRSDSSGDSQKSTNKAVTSTVVTIIPASRKSDAKLPVKYQAAQRRAVSRSRLHSDLVVKESLWFSVVLLLITSIGCCVICLYIFSSKGRTYYVDVAALSASVSIALASLGMRACRKEQFPNYNCASGFLIFLSCLNFIQCIVLGLLAIHWHPTKLTPQVDITTGFVCSLSFLTLFLGILGLSAFVFCKISHNRVRVMV